MCKQDGVDHLVRAPDPARGPGRRRPAVFVGGGPEQPLIEAYAARGVGDLWPCGRVSDESCRILSSADVAVDPDPKTAWSDQSTMNKIMEYMFFGLPIVCYDLTEHRSRRRTRPFVGRTRSRRWPRASAPSWTIPGVARMSRAAPSGCARSSCGSTRCRRSPTTQSSRLPDAARTGAASGVSDTDFWRGCRGRRGPGPNS